MTSQDHRHQRGLDDEHSVDALLAETGFQDDAELRDVLLQIRGLRTLDVPPPSAGLAALMDQDASPGDVVRPLATAARKRNRAVFTSLAVAASLGIAGGAAAGNETLRHGAEGTISSIVGWPWPRPPRSRHPQCPRRHPAQAPPSYPLLFRRLRREAFLPVLSPTTAPSSRANCPPRDRKPCPPIPFRPDRRSSVRSHPPPFPILQATGRRFPTSTLDPETRGQPPNTKGSRRPPRRHRARTAGPRRTRRILASRALTSSRPFHHATRTRRGSADAGYPPRLVLVRS
ncbi:hypothetical protein [Arthrobacter sp. SD76]|uniref:hypothetical protein n=1 Tax=Arthrobacter sp. SD76 TaxID=3415007 RepID=UPI003C755D98